MQKTKKITLHITFNRPHTVKHGGSRITLWKWFDLVGTGRPVRLDHTIGSNIKSVTRCKILETIKAETNSEYTVRAKKVGLTKFMV